MKETKCNAGVKGDNFNDKKADNGIYGSQERSGITSDNYQNSSSKDQPKASCGCGSSKSQDKYDYSDNIQDNNSYNNLQNDNDDLGDVIVSETIIFGTFDNNDLNDSDLNNISDDSNSTDNVSDNSWKQKDTPKC